MAYRFLIRRSRKCTKRANHLQVTVLLKGKSLKEQGKQEPQDVISHTLVAVSMTPIKVRGKRASVQTENSRNSSDSLLSPYGSQRGKRSMSPAFDFSLPPAKLPCHTDALSENRGRHARVAAPLEQLPIELLETIFFHHLNISLPQASPIIGSKLASQHVKTQLVLRVCSAGRLDTYPCEQAALFPTLAAQAQAQSAILQLRWMTLTFIRQLIPDYITKTLVRELSERRLQWLGKGPVVTKETESTIRQYLKDNFVRFTKRKRSSPPVFRNISWRIENPPRFIRLSFGLHDGLVTIEECRIHQSGNSTEHIELPSAEHNSWRIFCGINGCKVPDKLLHGPWTTEKCEFLEMVIRGNATVDWVGTTSGEVADQGLMQALRERNARATRLLVARAGSSESQALWGFPYSRYRNSTKILHSGPWPKENLSHAKSSGLRGVGVVPQTRHLRIAVLEACCRQDVVQALLGAEDTKIDFADRDVLDWAVEKRILGDGRGPWLLSMLS